MVVLAEPFFGKKLSTTGVRHLRKITVCRVLIKDELVRSKHATDPGHAKVGTVNAEPVSTK